MAVGRLVLLAPAAADAATPFTRGRPRPAAGAERLRRRAGHHAAHGGLPHIADPTLTPGQGTRFTFTSSEAGVATLTVQKQVKGVKVKVRDKRKCLPQTKKRLRALRRRAGSPAAYRRLLRKLRCTAYKKIGSIKQAVTPGQNTIVFSGRIAGRRLRPGRYRALLVIRDTAGNLSRVERVRFRVFRRR